MKKRSTNATRVVISMRESPREGGDVWIGRPHSINTRVPGMVTRSASLESSLAPDSGGSSGRAASWPHGAIHTAQAITSSRN